MEKSLFLMYKRFVAALLCVVFSFSMASCAKEETIFPDVPQNTTNLTEESNTSSANTDSYSIPEITVALPYETTTINYLAKLYYAKNNNLMGESSGNTIDLDYLNSLNPDFVINSIKAPSSGVNIDTLVQWESINAMPDLFLVTDVNAAKKSDYIISIDKYLYDDLRLNSNYIYLDTINELKFDGKLYGIPHYMSVMLLMGNMDYIPSTGKIPFKCNKEELKDYLSEISNQYSDAIPFSNASDLIPYLGASVDNDKRISYMLYNEYRNGNENYNELLNNISSYVDSFYDDGLSSNSTSEGSDPVYSRMAAMWLSSSADIEIWSKYYPDKLYFAQLPSADTSNSGVPYVNLYSICVSKNTKFDEFSVDFASFISMDPDAILLVERLEKMTGFFPVVKSQEVWNSISNDSIFGQNASMYSQILNNAVFVPNSRDNSLYKSVTNYLAEYKGGTISPEALYGN